MSPSTLFTILLFSSLTLTTDATFYNETFFNEVLDDCQTVKVDQFCLGALGKSPAALEGQGCIAKRDCDTLIMAKRDPNTKLKYDHIIVWTIFAAPRSTSLNPVFFMMSKTQLPSDDATLDNYRLPPKMMAIRSAGESSSGVWPWIRVLVSNASVTNDKFGADEFTNVDDDVLKGSFAFGGEDDFLNGEKRWQWAEFTSGDVITYEPHEYKVDLMKDALISTLVVYDSYDTVSSKPKNTWTTYRTSNQLMFSGKRDLKPITNGTGTGPGGESGSTTGSGGSPDPSSNDGLGAGVITVIVLAVIVVLALIAAIAYYFLVYKNKVTAVGPSTTAPDETGSNKDVEIAVKPGEAKDEDLQKRSEMDTSEDVMRVANDAIKDNDFPTSSPAL